MSHCAKPAEAKEAVSFTGVPAVLLSVTDDRDPVPVGEEVTYTISIVNQGSAPQTNVRITAESPKGMTITGAPGATESESRDGRAAFKPLPSLAPGARAKWKVTARASEPSDARFKARLESDQLESPAVSEEPTRLFK